jgi:hypothetical protein
MFGEGVGLRPRHLWLVAGSALCGGLAGYCQSLCESSLAWCGSAGAMYPVEVQPQAFVYATLVLSFGLLLPVAFFGLEPSLGGFQALAKEPERSDNRVASWSRTLSRSMLIGACACIVSRMRLAGPFSELSRSSKIIVSAALTLLMLAFALEPLRMRRAKLSRIDRGIVRVAVSLWIYLGFVCAFGLHVGPLAMWPCI